MKKRIIKIRTAGMDRDAWLHERRRSLGGSDMGAILGLNQWKSPYSVWAEKTGRVTEDRDSEAMRVGRDLEPYVAQRFVEASGLPVRRVNAILRNPSFPCIHANIDREIAGQQAGLECKTASALSESKFRDGFPESYYAQCVTYLAVTEYKRWYLAVLVMGRGFFIYQMTRIENDECPEWCEGSVYVSDDEINALRDAAIEFWMLVEQDQPPAVDGSDSATETIKTIYAESTDKRIDLSAPSISQAVSMYLKLKEEEKERKKLMEEQANIIRSYMKDAEGGICKHGRVSWKSQTRESFDKEAFKAVYPTIRLDRFTKTTTSRVFRVTAEKE